MSLALHIHPLSMPSWAVLIALYENETPFELNLVKFEKGADVEDLAMFEFYVPRLTDNSLHGPGWTGDDLLLHLGKNHPGRLAFESADEEVQRRIDGFTHCFRHLREPMLELVAQSTIAPNDRDPTCSNRAREYLEINYAGLEELLARTSSAMDGSFTVGDCWAAAALYHLKRVHPFSHRPRLTEYWRHLSSRPSVTRVRRELEPYFNQIGDWGMPVVVSAERKELIEHWFKVNAELEKGANAFRSGWEEAE